ncbi:sodium:proton antiporter [Microbacterium sp. STN6]|uniref:cation:proton antiporter n=1 Tax=Microbacterium sp. STN6 TaxID=2995588 RepID=UPI002260FC45|nr:sodium:proton antiporter [Microbacterium sp. STN6]MCX7521417.1 sodium:proton antiporter [Microbacterium sp. STN6]
METFLIIAVLGLMVIAASSAISERIRVAAPLLLVAVGLIVSLLPFVPAVPVEPEWILAGVLPPLLYSASVSMPSMDFRREFTAIGGLSVVLVVGSSVLLGLLFAWLIPGLGLPWGIALGAIVSPTDAVATSIVKRVGVSSRVVSILEGESLLNDATALVILRSAIAGAAASVSLWSVAGTFLYSAAVAVIIGFVIGKVNLWVRSRVTDSTVNTVLSFTVPFVASIPAELLGASGLVAAVVAGLVTGHGAARVLSPRHRLSDAQNWHTIELVLEGAVFLVMGLELSAVIQDVQADDAGIPIALGLAGAALLATILVRAAYVAPLLRGLGRRAKRGAAMKGRIDSLQGRLATDSGGRQGSPSRVQRLTTRLTRLSADIDYFLDERLGWREGVVVVWAGMRGAVTLAAAQTLPENTPNRSLLVLIAFLVATGSLLLQGGTLTWLVALVKPRTPDLIDETEKRGRLLFVLEQAALAVDEAAETGTPAAHGLRAAIGSPATGSPAATDSPIDEARGEHGGKRRTLAVIQAQRRALLDARDDGEFSADMLNAALAVLDADQISIELKGAPVDEL